MFTFSPVAETATTAPLALRPLFVDLDGSLVSTDVLWESFLQLCRRRPLEAARLAVELPTRGKAWFKQQVALTVDVYPETLPYRVEVLDFLRTERDRGRRLVLATAADRGVAERVAAHLDLFTAVLASDGVTNLSGRHKAAAIESWCQGEAFDYLGDSRQDLPVWEKAEAAFVVGGDARLCREVARVSTIERRFDTPVSPRVWVKAVRAHQWAKNLLVFVPLITSHNIAHLPKVWLAALCFLVFGLCASGTYLLNDLVDLEADRRHATKRSRPLAAGLVAVQRGLLVGVSLVLGAFALSSLLLGPATTWALALYLTMTLSYSVYLKRVVIVDVLVLAGLYTLRIVAGAAAVRVHLSFWLLAFSMFFFLSLAFVKRYTELLTLRSPEDGASSRMPGRDYQAEDAEMVRALGPASGYISVLVMALYINSPDVLPLYREPEYLWLICPLLLYWIARVWMLAHRGQMHDDPVAFALKDRQSYLLGVLAFTFVVLGATGGPGTSH